jgi:hypothetical protein
MEKMIPENRIPTHPGVVLKEEFLAPMGLTQVALAKHSGIPTQRINELIRGKRGVTLCCGRSSRPCNPTVCDESKSDLGK